MKKYQLAKTIIHETIEDESVIVAPNKAMISALNETGNRIFQLIAAGQPAFSEIVDVISEEYRVDRQEAEQDVRHFLNELLENGLIEEQ